MSPIFKSKAILMLLGARLLTNIGNGVHTLVLGKLLYEKTNSVLAFGSVFILESLISIVFDLFSGSLIDRLNPHRVAIYCDITVGLLVLAAGIGLGAQGGDVLLIASVLAVNISKPFYRNAMFAFIPGVVEKDQLKDYYGAVSACIQIGSTLGALLAGVLLTLANNSIAFVVDGATYLMSGCLLILIGTIGGVRSRSAIVWKRGEGLGALYRDWAEIRVILFKGHGLLWKIGSSTFDTLVVRLFNLMLVPLIAFYYANNAFYLSFFDSAFAVGAIVAGFAAGQMKINASRFIGCQLIKGIMFLAIITRAGHPREAVIYIFILAFCNLFTSSWSLSDLQIAITDQMRAKISSIRNVMTSVSSLAMIPLISLAYNSSVAAGVYASALTVIAFAGIAYPFYKTEQTVR